MTRRRMMLGITGWLFLGAVFGPPLFGAASTLFWVRAADGNTAVRVAWRTYDRVNPPTVGLAFINDAERLPEVSLGTSCHERYLERIRAGDPGTTRLLDAIRHYSEQRLHVLLREEPAHEALLSLPPPMLGALDACLGGSPLLWVACQSYGRRVTDEALAKRAKKRAEFADLVRRETEVIWCAAASADPAKNR